MSQPGIIAGQIDYYRARAPEYDQYYDRTGPFDLGDEENAAWRSELGQAETWLHAAVRGGSVLDLAAGTGWWTALLAERADRVTAADAAPEMLAVNRQRNDGAANVTYALADLFAFDAPERFDHVFFGFWLSHVPADRFAEFWGRVDGWLAPGGRAHFVDNITSSAPWIQERPAGMPDSELMTRRLNDGRTFTIVKTHWTAATLAAQLAELGWTCDLSETSRYFVYGSATPASRAF